MKSGIFWVCKELKLFNKFNNLVILGRFLKTTNIYQKSTISPSENYYITLEFLKVAVTKNVQAVHWKINFFFIFICACICTTWLHIVKFNAVYKVSFFSLIKTFP